MDVVRDHMVYPTRPGPIPTFDIKHRLIINNKLYMSFVYLGKIGIHWLKIKFKP